MRNEDSQEARERIINASIQLFSQKGFDATTTGEIASMAGVTKGLIYYYFTSKEEILNFLVDSLMKDATTIAMDFVHTGIVQMIRDGKLDIETDRLRFIDGGAVRDFFRKVMNYYERALDFVLEKRAVIRILMLESLKDSKHHNDLFRFMELTGDGEDNPVFKTIYEADRDFTYSGDMSVFKFFFSIIPLINFAAHYEEYKAISSMSDSELKDSFLRSFKIIFASLISGSEILLRNDKTREI